MSNTSKNTYKSKPENITKVVKKPSVWKKLMGSGIGSKKTVTSSAAKPWKNKILGWLWWFAWRFVAFTVVTVVLLRFLPIWFTPTMLDRKLSAIGAGEDSEINYKWTSYSNISREAALAVVASEDGLFPEHFGFDFKRMYWAFRGNLKGKKLKGASTISQQVAKNVFLWQGRSYIRKGLEVYFTFLIEVIWGKERILEVYLNVAEMGKMTFGVEAASQTYYGHSSSTLGRQEAARIAAVLPSPIRFSIKNPSNYVVKRTNTIARSMRSLGGKEYIKEL